METATALEQPSPLPPSPETLDALGGLQQPATAQQEWFRCRHWIERAMARFPAFESMADLERDLATDMALFWAGRDGACITRNISFPNGKALVVSYVDGDPIEGDRPALLQRWMGTLAAHAQATGCRYLMLDAPIGADPALIASFGLQQAFSVWIREMPPVAESASQPADAGEPSETAEQVAAA